MPRNVGRFPVLAAVAVFFAAANESKPTPEAEASNRTWPLAAGNPVPLSLPATSGRAAAIAHGGVGSPPGRSDGCRAAVDAALAVLEAGGDPLDAAVAGVVVMEDDPRFNAGTGSRVRIDGETVQMDASVMASDGRFGAVAVIENVRYPVQVARAVVDTPHIMLAGDGATRFARALGMESYYPGTAERIADTRAIQQRLLRNDPSLPPSWRTFDWRRLWNFKISLEEAGLEGDDDEESGEDTASDSGFQGSHDRDTMGSDTVGVAVRTADGRFGVALSTGGTAITLRGRVGDVPILGAGLYAGPTGASAATGVGERIIEAGLSRAVVGWLAEGASAQEAADRAVDMLRAKGSIGLIVISASAMAAAADRQMAWAARELGSATWLGPTP